MAIDSENVFTEVKLAAVFNWQQSDDQSALESKIQVYLPTYRTLFL